VAGYYFATQQHRAAAPLAGFLTGAHSYLAKQNPDGAAVMILLLQYLGHREQAEALLKATPQGSA